ncbi:MAG: cell division protein FtsA [Prevotellaceae bacterium]|jgi:cell division protein FtsA|nr:cell division protein FtsA [Prevotellaceae bacterium]
MEEYVAAIDLGTTKIVALVGEKTESGRFQIVAYSEAPSSGVSRGEVQNITQVENVVKPLVEEVRRQSGINFTEVYVGIAGQHIKCVENRADVIRNNSYDVEISEAEVLKLEKSIHEIRMDPGEEILHVIPQTYNVDDKIGVTDPVGMLGKRLEANYHVVIGKTISAEHTQRCIRKVGLELKRLVLEPIASASAVLTADEKEAGVAMVDIGGGTTDIIVYYDNVVRHTAVIPFGGNAITNDIKEGCGVLLRQAEQMKVQFGSCFGELASENKIITIPGISGREPREISFRTLAKIIEARMDEIIGAVIYEIERSGCLNKLNAGIVFTGGGSLIDHLSQFVKYKTGLDVRIGRPLYLTTDSGQELQRPTFSTAIGLIMKGFEYDKQEEKNNKVKEEESANARKVEMDVTEEFVEKGKKEKKRKKDEESTGSKNPLQVIKDIAYSIFDNNNEDNKV